MKLFLVSQTINLGYDTTDAIIVAAKDESEAKKVKELDEQEYGGTWVKDVADLIAEEIGTAKKGTKRGIILESFNAG